MPANEDHNAAGWALYSAPTRDAAMLEKAIAHFEAALVENPDAGTALSNLLDALLAAGREFEAVARAGLHAGVDRGSSRANNWLGWYYLNTKKDLPRALEHLERAATWGGWWGVAHLNYAVALEISGDVDKAYAQIGRRARSRRSTSHKRDSVTQMRAACHREEPWFSYVLGPPSCRDRLRERRTAVGLAPINESDRWPARGAGRRSKLPVKCPCPRGLQFQLRRQAVRVLAGSRADTAMQARF